MAVDRSSQNTRSADVFVDFSQLSLEDDELLACGDACRRPFRKGPPLQGNKSSGKKGRMARIAEAEDRRASVMYAAKLRECLLEDGGVEERLQALRLKIAAWQSTFPEYLPAPVDLGDVCHHSVSERPRSSDYVAPLTAEELAGVPRHARGRLSLEENNALVDAFNEALSHKYRLLAMPKSQLRRALWTKAATYRHQETSETKRRRFITEDDLVAAGGGFASRSAVVAFALLLRHCGRIRELRGPGRIVRYALI